MGGKADLQYDNGGGYLHHQSRNGVSEKREDDSSHLNVSHAADPKLLTTDARAHTSCAFHFTDREARIPQRVDLSSRMYRRRYAVGTGRVAVRGKKCIKRTKSILGTFN